MLSANLSRFLPVAEQLPRQLWATASAPAAVKAAKCVSAGSIDPALADP
jgi:hypothetical protein